MLDSENRQRTVQLDSSCTIMDLAFADGNFVIGCADGTLFYVNVTTGGVLRTVMLDNPYAHPVRDGSKYRALKISPTLACVAGHGNNQSRLWLMSLPDGALLHYQWLDGRTVWGFAFSPSGQRLAAGMDTQVHVIDSISAAILCTVFLTGIGGGVLALAFSPDGEQLSAGRRDVNKLTLMDSESGAICRTIDLPGEGIQSLVYSPTGMHMAVGCGMNDQIEIVHAWSGSVLCTVQLQGSWGIWALTYAPHGEHLAASCGNGQLYFIDACAGAVLHTVQVSCNDMWTVMYMPEDAHAMAVKDASSAVIQEIRHHECAAVRDEEVMSLTVQFQNDEDFAVHAETMLQDRGVEPMHLSDKVHLISFRSGKGEVFRRKLLKGPEFRHLRGQLEEERYPVELQPSKAIVLVRPEQYRDTVNSPTLTSCTLKRYNVIIAESEEYLMDEILEKMASKQRPRENRSERVELDLDLNFVTKRTFICNAPKPLPASIVTQSTTEAVRSCSSASASYLTHFRGDNPRRK